MKKETGIWTASPGFKVCSVKQKHCTFVKYWPMISGLTLKTADPVTVSFEWFTARKKASLFSPT